MTRSSLRIGTRGSGLALAQADWVAHRLQAVGVSCELVTIATRGDELPDDPISSIGTRGVFTREVQKALLDGRIDVAVHSLKDLPTEPVKGLTLTAVPERESPFDVLVSRDGTSWESLPRGAKIGTGSVRRKAQLLHARADLQFADIRGNVDTRLRKLEEGQYDALVLAEAGLIRLGLAQRITQVLPASLIVPAAGQGALGIETRAGDQATRHALAPIDDAAAHQSAIAERTLVAALRGGCLAPVGAWARLEDDGRLHLSACVVSAAGTRRVWADLLANAAEAVQLGRQAAEQLLADGAAELIEAARSAP